MSTSFVTERASMESYQSLSDKSTSTPPSEEKKKEKEVVFEEKKINFKYSKFNAGNPIQDLSDVKITDLIKKRIPNDTFNTINVEQSTHTFSSVEKNFFCRKITLIREFSWDHSNFNYSTFRIYPAYIREQVFGEDSKEGRQQIQNASYIYKRIEFFITEDCQLVEMNLSKF